MAKKVKESRIVQQASKRNWPVTALLNEIRLLQNCNVVASVYINGFSAVLYPLFHNIILSSYGKWSP